MCGIFGCVLRNNEAAPLIRAALKRLEYRGYDSVGEATIHNNMMYIRKDQGKIDDVNKKHNLDDLPGRIGIGTQDGQLMVLHIRSMLIHITIVNERLLLFITESSKTILNSKRNLKLSVMSSNRKRIPK